MDYRKEKTRRAIREAFLQLRSGRNLEKITVKELTELARISKATFYLHYRDIFDLSEQLQREAIQRVIAKIPDPMGVLTDLARFMRDMTGILEQDTPELVILFSDSQEAALPVSLEEQIKSYIFEKQPELRDDPRVNIHLSYHIYGSYYAFMRNCRKQDPDDITRAITEIQKKVPAPTKQDS